MSSLTFSDKLFIVYKYVKLNALICEQQNTSAPHTYYKGLIQCDN